jgi:hypothetical protein
VFNVHLPYAVLPVVFSSAMHSTETLIDASREDGLEINVEKS